MKLRIKEVMTLADQGYTREQLIQHFKISKKDYLHQLAIFCMANVQKLRNLMIKNGKRSVTKNISNSTDENFKYEFENIEKEIKIYDTSYIMSGQAEFNEIDENSYILPRVYEQLVYHEKRGSTMVKKLFYMILDGKISPKLVKKDYSVENVPDYEDSADFEIINFAQKVKSGEVRDVIGTPVVYTQDKALALRCRQQEIKYVFIHRNDGKKSVEKSDSKNRGNKVYVQSRRKILEVGKEELARNNLKGYIKKIGSKIGIIQKNGILVYDKNFKLKKIEKFGMIPLANKDTIILGNKVYVYSGVKFVEVMPKNS